MKHGKAGENLDTHVLKHTVVMRFLCNFICHLIYVMGITPKNFTMYYERIKKNEEDKESEKK